MSVSTVVNASEIGTTRLWGLINRIIIQVIFVFFLIFWLSRRQEFDVLRGVRLIAWIYLIFGILASIAALQFVITGRALFGPLLIEPMRWPQLYGWFASPNYFVDAVAIAASSSFFLFSSSAHKAVTVSTFCYFIFLFLILLFTGSRGGILSFFIAFSFQIAVSISTCRHDKKAKRSLRKKMNFTFVVVVLFFFMVLVFLQAKGISLDSLGRSIWRRGLSDIANEPRIEIWAHALQNYSMRSSFGLLFGAGNDVYLQEEGRSTHNSYLVLLLDYGMITLLLFIVFMSWIALYIIRMIKLNARNPLIGKILAFLISPIVYNFLRAFFQGGILLGGAIGWIFTILGVAFLLMIRKQQTTFK